MARKRLATAPQTERRKSKSTVRTKSTRALTKSGKAAAASGVGKSNHKFRELSTKDNRKSELPKTKTIKLTTVGSSTGLVLPKEILERMRVGKGDLLHVIETRDGIELTPYDPEFAMQFAVAEEVMRTDRDVLKQLAK
jgi:putative addiction module antidote